MADRFHGQRRSHLLAGCDREWTASVIGLVAHHADRTAYGVVLITDEHPSRDGHEVPLVSDTSALMNAGWDAARAAELRATHNRVRTPTWTPSTGSPSWPATGVTTAHRTGLGHQSHCATPVFAHTRPHRHPPPRQGRTVGGSAQRTFPSRCNRRQPKHTGRPSLAGRGGGGTLGRSGTSRRSIGTIASCVADSTC